MVAIILDVQSIGRMIVVGVRATVQLRLAAADAEDRKQKEAWKNGPYFRL